MNEWMNAKRKQALTVFRPNCGSYGFLCVTTQCFCTFKNHYTVKWKTVVYQLIFDGRISWTGQTISLCNLFVDNLLAILAKTHTKPKFLAELKQAPRVIWKQYVRSTSPLKTSLKWISKSWRWTLRILTVIARIAIFYLRFSAIWCSFLSSNVQFDTFHHHHHHHERAPGWSVAVSTSCLHRSLSWASRHAELSPWLSGWRSAFTVRSHVWRGRPGRRLQSLGSRRVDVWRALKVGKMGIYRRTIQLRHSCPRLCVFQNTAFRCWSNRTWTGRTSSTVHGPSSKWASVTVTATTGWATTFCTSWHSQAATS